jgi:hypothetical protein
LFWVVALLEWLKSRHEVVPTSNAVGNNSFSDTGSDSTLDDGSDGVHRSDDLGLELRWHVKFNLLEEVF